MAADERRVEPFERHDPRRGGALDRAPDRSQAVAQLQVEALATLRNPARLAEPDLVRQHLVERLRVEREHVGLARQAARDRAHVIEGHGAHRTERLRHDQVGRELLELLESRP